MTRSLTLPSIFVFLLFVVACGDDTESSLEGIDTDTDAATDEQPSADAGVPDAATADGAMSMATGPYADDSLWLCNPRLSDDLCLAADLSATEVGEDGSFTTVPHTAADDPPIDCFYIYPTVNLSFDAGNTEDLSDLDPVLVPLLNQAARLSSVCRVFAPLYRQMSIGVYVSAADQYETTDFFATAYGDVSDAFDHYLEHESDGRDFVLVGHSQGTHMLTRLLQDRFDDDPAMRDRLVSALLIGPTGRIHVPPGELTGGTFENLPLCQAEDETGCIITFDSQAAGLEPLRLDAVPIPDGMARPCANPAALAGGSGTLAATIWASDNGMPFPDMVVDPWASYPLFHTAECDADGALVIDAIADDPRTSPATPQEVQMQQEAEGFFALHLSEFNYVIGDLLRIVETQAAAK